MDLIQWIGVAALWVGLVWGVYLGLQRKRKEPEERGTLFADMGGAVILVVMGALLVIPWADLFAPDGPCCPGP
jgi:hypothetical protein